jgi:hypothetical protein
VKDVKCQVCHERYAQGSSAFCLRCARATGVVVQRKKQVECVRCHKHWTTNANRICKHCPKTAKPSPPPEPEYEVFWSGQRGDISLLGDRETRGPQYG